MANASPAHSSDKTVKFGTQRTAARLSRLRGHTIRQSGSLLRAGWETHRHWRREQHGQGVGRGDAPPRFALSRGLETASAVCGSARMGQTHRQPPATISQRQCGTRTKATWTSTLTGHTCRSAALAFSQDGKRIVAAAEHRIPGQGLFRPGEVKVWDADKGTESFTLRGHARGVSSVAFSPDGKRIVSAHSYDKTLKVWDATMVRRL